jgi:hypothetical protein
MDTTTGTCQSLGGGGGSCGGCNPDCTCNGTLTCDGFVCSGCDDTFLVDPNCPDSGLCFGGICLTAALGGF